MLLIIRVSGMMNPDANFDLTYALWNLPLISENLSSDTSSMP